jgi:MFS family permease
MFNRKQLSGHFSFNKYDKGVWLMIIVRFFGMLGFAVYGPFFMLYLNQNRGITLTLAGMIVAFSNILSAVSQMLGGVFTDRFGRRHTLLIFFGLSGLINILLTVMVASSASVWLFASVYIFSGFILGMSQPALIAIITDLAPKNNLTEAYGLSQIVANIGWVVGPLLGGVMYARLSFAYLFAVTIITGALSFILVLTALHDSFTGTKEKMNPRSTFSAGKDSALLTYVILSLLVFIVYTQIVNTYTVFTVDHLGFSTTQYGLLLTINGVLAVVFQYPITRLVDTHLGDKNALFLGSVLFGMAFLSMSWITSYGWSIGAITIFTVAELLFVPSSTSIVGKLAEPEQRGRYIGLLGTGSGLGLAIGPLVGGSLLDVSGSAPIVIWGTIAAVAFIAAIGFLYWFSANRKRLL